MNAAQKPILMPSEHYVQMETRRIKACYNQYGGSFGHEMWEYIVSDNVWIPRGGGSIPGQSTFVKGVEYSDLSPSPSVTSLAEAKAALGQLNSVGWGNAGATIMKASSAQSEEIQGVPHVPVDPPSDPNELFFEDSWLEEPAKLWRGEAMEVRMVWKKAAPRAERLDTVSMNFLKVTRQDGAVQSVEGVAMTLLPGAGASTTKVGMADAKLAANSSAGTLEVALMPVEIVQPQLDSAGNVVRVNSQDVLETVASVRFCRWSSAFMFPDSTFNHGFHATDRDRFQIRLPNLDRIDKVKVGSIGLNVDILGVAEDDLNEVTLVRPSGSNDTLSAIPLVTVVDRVDDQSYNGGAANDNDTDDATTMASFGASIKVNILMTQGAPLSFEWPVKRPEGKVKIKPILITPDDILSIDDADRVKAHIKAAKAIYSQIGIEVESEEIRTIVYPTGTVNLFADGILNNNDVINGAEWDQFIAALPTTTGSKTIPVYFVDAQLSRLNSEGLNSYSGGITWTGPGDSRDGVVIVSLILGKPPTTAHEMGHALGLGHAIEGVFVPYRLMTDQGIDMLGLYSDSKRISPGEESVIKMSRFYEKRN